MIDSEGRIRAWWQGAQQLLGYTSDELIGRDVSILYTPEDVAAGIPRQDLWQATNEGRAHREGFRVSKNGDRLWMDEVTTALHDASGTLTGYLKIGRDLTERHLAEKALEESKQAAENASRVKDEFLATVSHELRTPLSAILLWTKILRGEAPEPERLVEGLRSIHDSAVAQKELIEDLLDVSRITMGTLRLRMREVELMPLVRDALDAIRPTAEARNVELTADLSTRAGVTIADPDRIRQVVWNLLTNAVKFTPSGGRVAVQMRRDEGIISIRVSDTGRGIDADFLPHVFERFRQADASHTRTQGGMGLGLSISKQLVELHGGTISVESAGIDKGATFKVTLPLPKVPAKRQRAEAQSSSQARADKLRGSSVLLVDDDAGIRAALATLLRQHGMTVTDVESAGNAFKAFEKSRPTFIIGDIGLPGEDGYTMIRRIRAAEKKARTPRVPAIALTALVRDTDRQVALAAGFQLDLGKPVDPEHLLDALAELLPTPQ